MRHSVEARLFLALKRVLEDDVIFHHGPPSHPQRPHSQYKHVRRRSFVRSVVQGVFTTILQSSVWESSLGWDEGAARPPYEEMAGITGPPQHANEHAACHFGKARKSNSEEE